MTPRPTLSELFELFFGATPPRHAIISAGEMPEPYRTLLVHSNHMTVTVENFYREPVSVQVLDLHRKDDTYARRILLRTSPRVVQFGLVEIDLSMLPEAVRKAIEA